METGNFFRKYLSVSLYRLVRTICRHWKDKASYCLVTTFLIGIPVAQAGPQGGNIVGGSGSISQSGLATNINQSSQSLAINWNSFDIQTDEIVNFNQPGKSAIALNRIIGNNASEIFGQLNADGQVFLVNPNGIFFGQNASINVGGLIASGLDISPSAFMNGEYVFKEVLGTEGTVVNSGLINAALGGNVALIGKQVKNEGVISAKLGSINLSAGKGAVLTFDNLGLIGVRVTEEVLQDELGIDPAVINSGEIQAEGGHVLLSARVSRDVFSEAVNHDGIEQATNAVVHEDGSFTLGGSDLLNTGTIDVSAENDAGQVALIGGNVIHEGNIHADSQQGNGGIIKIESSETSLLTGNSETTATSYQRIGGDIHVLGDTIGLLNQSGLNASGATSGGEILIGGDFQGATPHIRNATYTFVDTGVDIVNDAITNGDGGKTILWSDKDTIFQGQISSTGGSEYGNGGFIEVSGKEKLFFSGSTDRSAINGDYGTLLLDPRDITIASSGSNDGALPTIVFGNSATVDFTVSSGAIETELITGNVLLQANRNINIDSSINAVGNSNTLSLEAGDTINISSAASINLAAGDLSLTAGSAGCVAGATCAATLDKSITINGVIDTSGDITLQAADDVFVNGQIGSTTAPASLTVRAGDNITVDSPIITNSGAVSFTAADSTLVSGGVTVAPNTAIDPVFGDISISADITTNGGDFNANTTAGFFSNDNVTISTGAGNVSIQADGVDEAAASNYSVIFGDVVTTTGNLTVTSTGGPIIQGDNPTPNVLLIGGTTLLNAGGFRITLDNNNDFNVIGVANTAGDVTLNDINSIQLTTSTVTDNLLVTANGAGNITQSTGAVSVTGTATFVANGDDIILGHSGNDFSTVITTANNVTVVDSNDIVLGDTTVGNDLSVTSNGDITDQDGATLDITGTTVLNSGPGNITLNNTTNDFSSTINEGLFITAGGDVTLEDTNNINLGSSLGLSVIGGNLDVIADNDINDEGVLSVSGTTNLESTGNNDDITLDEVGHNLQGAITVATTGGSTANVRIDNDAVTTLINGATVDGDLLINADRNLTIGGTLAVVDDFIVTINGSSDSVVNINSSISSGGVTSITGGTGVDTFNIIGNVNGAIDGNTGNDTFNLNAAALTINDLRGGGDTDTLNGFDGTSIWDITNIGAGSVGNVDFSEIEAVNGGTAEDTLNGPTGAVTWTLGTLGNANNGTSDWLTTGFTGFEHFVGQGGVDTFNLITGGGFTTIDGGGNSDVLDASASTIDSFTLGTDLISVEDITGNNAIASTLIAATGNNDWTITGINQGEVVNSGDTVVFSGFNNVTGSSGDDLFQFDTGAGIDGTIDAGAEVNGDTVDYSNLGDVSIILADAFNGVINAETIQADDNFTTELVGSNANTIWTIDGLNSGTVDGIDFIGFNNLTGGSGDDTFTLNGGTIDGTIDGGAHVLGDIVDYSLNTGALNISLASGSLFSGVINAETIQGNNINSTLIGDNFDTTWTINNDNDGTVSWNDGSANSVSFIDFNNLTGGSADDSFIYSGAGDIDGTIDGGAHSTGDSLDLSALVTAAINIDNLTNIEQVIGNNLDSSLTGGAFNNNWVITGINSGTVNGFNFIDFNNLIGGSSDDNFSFTPGGSVTGTIDGGAHVIADTLDYSALATVAVNIDSLINIERVVGNNTDSTLTGGTGANTWSVTGANSGTVNGFSFIDFNHLTGGSGDDSFSFTPTGSVSGVVDGGAQATEDSINFSALAVVDVDLSNNGFLNFERYVGNDTNSTLAGADLANTWNITGANDGNLNGSISFENFNNLTGGNADDSFVFAAAGVITGNIDGGLGSVDTIDQSAVTSVSLNLGDGSINDIERLVGNNTDSTLTGANNGNIWTISASNSGNVDGIIFTSFNNLNGGTADDQYNIGAAGSISGVIDGGGQVSEDRVNLAALAVVVVDIGDGSYVDIERFIGNNSNSSLTGANVTNTWTITGFNDGSVNGINFENFNQLVGGNQTDNFSVSGNGSLGGEANGGAGNDTATVTLSGIENGNFVFIGGADTDSLSINGGHAAYIADYRSDNGSGLEQFVISQGGNNYTINYNQTQNVNAGLTLDELRINGTGGDDSIDLGTSQFAVNSASVVNHSGNNNLGIDGLTGSDIVTNNNSSFVTAGILSISNVDSVGSGANALNTNIAELRLNNIGGDVFIDELNQISLGALSNSGSLTLSNQSGDIDDSAILNSAGALTLTAQNGNILLDQDHQLTGALMLTAGGNIALKNTQDTLIAGISAQTLNLDSDGDISQSGGISTIGGTILSSAQDILLDDSNNQLVQLDITTARNANVNNNGNLGLNRLDVDSQLTLSAVALTDNNGDDLNLVSQQLVLSADNGIGDGNSIEINTDQLTADNRLGGDIELEQRGGDIELITLQNTGSSGDITFAANRNILFNPGSTVAVLGTGDLLMRTDRGSYLGLGQANANNPDITAQNAAFVGPLGVFGSRSRPLTLNVPGSVTIFTRGVFDPIFVVDPADYDPGESINFNALGNASTELIEVETLSDIDPAIFTDLRNYSYENIAIRLPRDQLFEDELEALEGGGEF